MVSRRGFLKLLGSAAIAAVAAPSLIQPSKVLAAPPKAPLFVPSHRLDFGVPHQIITSTDDLKRLKDQFDRQPKPEEQAAQMGRTVPMTLIYNEYLRQYGGRLKAGTTVLVDQPTADRWLTKRIAVPGVAQADVRTQNRAATRWLAG